MLLSKNTIHYGVNRLTGRLDEMISHPVYKKIASSYDINGYKRIYHVHIRKTAGTSLNQMFLSHGGSPHALYSDLINSRSHRVIKNGKVFVGWNTRLINQGDYYYAYSHTPYHHLNLPPNTYKITIFRDPVKRILSLYTYLLHYVHDKPNHPLSLTQGCWVGESFDHFLEHIPKKHLLNQLHMFSKSYSIENALERINRLEAILTTDCFENGINKVANELGVILKPRRANSTPTKYSFTPSHRQLETLHQLLAPEYAMLKEVQAE